MIRARACDPCALRKAKCDRGSPCRRCSAQGLSCTLLRKSSKPGPKGPWAGKKRARAKLQSAPLKNSSVGLAEGGQPGNLGPPNQDESNYDAVLVKVERCLRIYRQHSYSLWPVVDVQNLRTRLRNHLDVAAYALGTALGAVMADRIHHLQASSDTDEYPELDSKRLASESETARMEGAYQENPSLYTILSSFFLHIHSANRGQLFKATLLLREAITIAQLLGLDRPGHYAGRSATEAQGRLRIIWLLHITERYDRGFFPVRKGLSLSQSSTLGVTQHASISRVPFTLIHVSQHCTQMKTRSACCPFWVWSSSFKHSVLP